MKDCWEFLEVTQNPGELRRTCSESSDSASGFVLLGGGRGGWGGGGVNDVTVAWRQQRHIGKLPTFYYKENIFQLQARAREVM